MKYIIFGSSETGSGYQCWHVKGLAFNRLESAERVAEYLNHVSYDDWVHDNQNATDKKRCDIYSVHREDDLEFLERLDSYED